MGVSPMMFPNQNTGEPPAPSAFVERSGSEIQEKRTADPRPAYSYGANDHPELFRQFTADRISNGIRKL